MKRRLAALFRRLEDFFDPSGRRLESDRIAALEKRVKEQLDRANEAVFDLVTLRKELAPVTIPDSAPDWQPEHMVALRSFLVSPTGQVLLTRGRCIHFDLARNANADVFHTSHSAGNAQGFGQCLEWLESLSRASRASDASLVVGATPQTDTASNGESELRERMSP